MGETKVFVNRIAYCCGFCKLEYQRNEQGKWIHPQSDCPHSGMWWGQRIEGEPLFWYEGEWNRRVSPAQILFVKVEVGSDEYNALMAEQEELTRRRKELMAHE